MGVFCLCWCFSPHRRPFRSLQPLLPPALFGGCAGRRALCAAGWAPVVSGYRHRLGLLVKAANHAYTQSNEPTLRAIDAWNAEGNTRMRAVNTTLGFQPVDRWSVLQLPVPAS